MAELHFEAGQIAFWKGFITYRQRELETTEAYWLEYMHHAHVFSRTDRRYPPRTPGELGYANNNLGTLAEARGELEDAFVYFSESADLQRTLLDPEDISTVVNLANSLSWQARVASALGQADEAWRIYQESLNLAAAQRQHARDDARRRTLEINTRYILAHLAHQLQLYALSLEHLRLALPLAEMEVENEPDQPQMQSQLARIAFMLARTPGTDETEAQAALARGEQAVEAAQALGLDPQRALELPALRALAHLHHGKTDWDTIDQQLTGILQALDQRESFDSPFFNLVEIVTETMQAFPAADRAYERAWVERLQARLDAVPENQKQSLRYQLARLATWQLLDQSSAQKTALELRVEKTRQSVLQIASTHP
jgi:tetratricopeptide (TPR) repeat protein